MNKRKASADRNGKQKAPSRRPSVANLMAKSVNAAEQRPREKSPPIHNFREMEGKSSPRTMGKGVDISIPKTRFSSRDGSREPRSNSSPRLRSFPAEEIKKLESPPHFSPRSVAALIAQKNPRETDTVFVVPSSGQNNGQGDALAGTQPSNLYRQQQPRNVQSAIQQQVASRQAVHQIGQPAPNSESVLSQQAGAASNQAHRPFVPNTAHDYSPRRIAGFSSFQSSLPSAEVPATPRKIQAQGNATTEQEVQGEGTESTSPCDYDKQPVGGRNAVAHRRFAMQNKQQQSQISMDPNVSNLSNDSSRLPCVPSNYPGHVPAMTCPNHQNPEQVYQQLQQNIAQQQQMQQRAMNQQLRMSQQQGQPGYYSPQIRQFPGQGMTSPQDATANEMKNARHLAMQQRFPAYHRDIGYSMSPQNEWNNRAVSEHTSLTAQLKPFTVDVVGNRSQVAGQNQQQAQMTAQNQQQAQMIAQNQQRALMVAQTQQQAQIIAQNQQQAQMIAQNQLQAQMIAQNQQQAQLAAKNQQQAHWARQNQQQIYRQMLPQQRQPTAMQQRQPAAMQSQPYPNSAQANAIYANQQRLTQHSAVHQANVAQTLLNQQSPSQSSPNFRSEEQSKQTGRKKNMQFTPDMIRDQELLVSTMKQQGIPDETMRRQFDALLNEQRRHLIYLEEMQKPEEATDTKRPVAAVRRSRQAEEKPEWMVHITPPRVSYTEVDKLRAARSKEQSEPDKSQLERRAMQQVSHDTTNETTNRHSHPQQNSYQFYQQPNWQSAPPSYVYQQPYVAATNNANESSRQIPHPPAVYPQQYLQYPYPYAPNFQQQAYNQQFQQHEPQNEQGQRASGENESRNPPSDDSKRTEPSSLLQMRVYKEMIRPQKRNNGLQDPEIAQRTLDALKNSEDAKGLEYLANLSPKRPLIKLNGIQESGETHPDQRPAPGVVQVQKMLPANGLENARNSNNPLQRRLRVKKLEEEIVNEYPRQKQNNPRNCYSMQAERENGTVAGQQQPQQQQQYRALEASYNEKNSTTARGNIMPFRFDAAYPQYYQQIQQYYQNARNLRNNGEGDIVAAQRDDSRNSGNSNRAGGDASEILMANDGAEIAGKNVAFQAYGDAMQEKNGQFDIQETRTIGGIKYLARKPDYIPNTQMISPDTLIASRHLQPPIIC